MPQARGQQEGTPTASASLRRDWTAPRDSHLVVVVRLVLAGEATNLCARFVPDVRPGRLEAAFGLLLVGVDRRYLGNREVHDADSLQFMPARAHETPCRVALGASAALARRKTVWSAGTLASTHNHRRIDRLRVDRELVLLPQDRHALVDVQRTGSGLGPPHGGPESESKDEAVSARGCQRVPRHRWLARWVLQRDAGPPPVRVQRKRGRGGGGVGRAGPLKRCERGGKSAGRDANDAWTAVRASQSHTSEPGARSSERGPLPRTPQARVPGNHHLPQPGRAVRRGGARGRGRQGLRGRETPLSPKKKHNQL